LDPAGRHEDAIAAGRRGLVWHPVVVGPRSRASSLPGCRFARR